MDSIYRFILGNMNLRQAVHLLLMFFIFTFISSGNHCAASETEYKLFLTRHYEKVKQVKNPSLTEAGKARADMLAQHLKDLGIANIYSTRFDRTQQTAEPVAKLLGLSIIYYDHNKLTELAKRLLEQKQTALIVGHSNTTPTLIDLLGGDSERITESDYGELFILGISRGDVTTQSVLVDTL